MFGSHFQLLLLECKGTPVRYDPNRGGGALHAFSPVEARKKCFAYLLSANPRKMVCEPVNLSRQAQVKGVLVRFLEAKNERTCTLSKCFKE